MVQMHVKYSGNRRCDLTHGPSGSRISSDPPIDNGGKGEFFSPTDMVASSLGSCILLTMAMVAERDGVSIEGAEASVGKEMISNPRRIGRVPVELKMPKGIPHDYRKKLEMVALGCPVHKSLNPEIEKPITFTYPD